MFGPLTKNKVPNESATLKISVGSTASWKAYPNLINTPSSLAFGGAM
jgi:hypothetical protein